MPDDRVVVVTGSTRGIGRGLAEDFLKAGCRVVVNGRDHATAEAVAKELDPERAVGIACDVSDRAQVQALWDASVERFGRVDIWINNAGISHRRVPLPEQDFETIAQVVDINLMGVLHGCSVAIAGMKEQGDGWVWNMEGFGSSGRVAPGLSIYGATKRAVTYLTKALVKETKDTPVKVGWLSPGMVVTELLVHDYDGQREMWERAKRIFNILADEVHTVTPFLVKGVLGASKSGTRVAWLTGRKAAVRFATARFRKRELPLPEPSFD